jgi:hypothetical protein
VSFTFHWTQIVTSRQLTYVLINFSTTVPWFKIMVYVRGSVGATSTRKLSVHVQLWQRFGSSRTTSSCSSSSPEPAPPFLDTRILPRLLSNLWERKQKQIFRIKMKIKRRIYVRPWAITKIEYSADADMEQIRLFCAGVGKLGDSTVRSKSFPCLRKSF